MNDYSVRGRNFRTGNDYQAALRDDKRIELLIKKYENADSVGKENIINVLNRGDIKFETLLGDDFIYELEERYKSEKAQLDTDNKQKKAHTRVINSKLNAIVIFFVLDTLQFPLGLV